MELGLQGKLALVTGGSKGIGKACALAFAKEGVDVVINGDKDVASAEAAAEEIRALGRRSIVIMADVASETEVKEMVDRVIREWGGIDILVNNAGISTIAMVEDTEKSDWDRVLSVHLDGAFNCSKAVIDTMRKRGGGKIINMASVAGLRRTWVTGPHYTTAKAGILGLTRHLAWELAHFKINVNAISPGNVRTPALERYTTSKEMENLMWQYPLGGFPDTDDIADAVLFLASDRAKMIAGCNIIVDGGFALGMGCVDWETYVKKKKEAIKRKR